MSYGTKVLFDAVREAAFGSITTSYTLIGTATTAYCRLLNINNNTNGDVFISFDGVTNHLHLTATTTAASQRQFNFTNNRVNDAGFFLAKGTGIYIKSGTTPPSAGSVIVEVVYGAPPV